MPCENNGLMKRCASNRVVTVSGLSSFSSVKLKVSVHLGDYFFRQYDFVFRASGRR